MTSWRRWALIAVVALVAWRSTVVVGENESVILTRVGRPVRTIADAGLHLRWPIDRALRFDRRLRVAELRPTEFLTRDKKNLVIDLAVCWRIVEPGTFLRSVDGAPGAELRLSDLAWSTLAAAVGNVDLSDLVSSEPDRVRTADLLREVTGRVAEAARERFGIAVEDVQVRRLNFPDQNMQAVFARMRAERERIAREYRAVGEERAMAIRAEADRERDRILAEAYRDAERARGEAEAEATRIFGAAHATDPEFFRFVRTLEAYEKLLDDKTTLVISADSPLFRLLVEGRSAGGR
jgi:membrane protease subunit HflC